MRRFGRHNLFFFFFPQRKEWDTCRKHVVPLFWCCPKACKMILLVTHQCSYLCHIIQTVENILPCFLRLNPRLCLMIIWCLLKTGERRWPELPSNQLWITCYLQLMPHPALIRDHYMPLAWALSPLWLHDTFCVIWRFLFFTSEDPPPNEDHLPDKVGVPKVFYTLPQCEAQHLILTARSPLLLSLGSEYSKHAGTRDSRPTCITSRYDYQK